jgi:outer membrane immunogenic protein
VNAPFLGGFALSAPGVAQIQDIETKLGRIGLRIGTNVNLGSVVVQPFVSGSIWHDFAGNVATAFTADPAFAALVGLPGLTGNVTTTRVETFGQVSVGAAYSVIGTGWVGYTRFDYRKGDDIESIAFNGGLRYMFNADRPIVAAAGGKGMYTKAPVGPVIAPFTWTGFYTGGFVGGAVAARNVRATEIAPGPGPFAGYNGVGTTVTYGLDKSVIAGSTMGWNQQFGWLVAGIEGEVGFIRLRGSGAFPTSPALDTVSATRTADWYGVIAGRLGLAFDRALLYAKGGAAFVGVSSSVTDFCIAFPCGAGVVGANGGSSIRPTWAAGGGIEYAFTNNWTLKAEYLYLDTEQSYVASGPGNNSFVGGSQIYNWVHDVPGIHTGKLGINYKFDVAAAPVSAKY